MGNSYVAPLGVNSPGVMSGVKTQYSAANYIASDAIAAEIGLHEPNVNPNLVERYGNQELTGLLAMVKGYTKEVTGRQTYYHFEDDFIHGIVRVAAYTNPGVVTTDTLTIGSTAKAAIPWAVDPYLEASTPKSINAIVPQKYDLLQLPGRVEVIVSEVVDKAAGTFTVYTVAGGALPDIAADDEIIIKGSLQREASTKGESRNSKLITYKNNTFKHRRDHEVTGTEYGEQTWMELKGKGGKKQKLWFLKGMYNEYQRFLNEREMMLFDGKQVGNDDLTLLDGFETVTGTEGLISTIEFAGNEVTYTTLALSNYDSMNRSLNKYKGDKLNLLMQGYNFASASNGLFRTGAGLEAGSDPVARVELSSNSGVSDMAINLDFERVKYNGFTYLMKTTNAFSDPVTLGAVGQGYEDFGLVLPMGSTTTYSDLNDRSSSTQSKTICMRYKVGGKGENRAYLETMSGWGYGGSEDSFGIHMVCEVGFELAAANRFGIFNK